MQLNVTEAAKNKIKKIADLPFLRISVDSGGCSGFKYSYEFVDSTDFEDYVFENDGIKIVVDKVSQDFLNNSTLDYEESIGFSSFAIKNPNASIKCGCGNSFSI